MSSVMRISATTPRVADVGTRVVRSTVRPGGSSANYVDSTRRIEPSRVTRPTALHNNHATVNATMQHSVLPGSTNIRTGTNTMRDAPNMRGQDARNVQGRNMNSMEYMSDVEVRDLLAKLMDSHDKELFELVRACVKQLQRFREMQLVKVLSALVSVRKKVPVSVWSNMSGNLGKTLEEGVVKKLNDFTSRSRGDLCMLVMELEESMAGIVWTELTRKRSGNTFASRMDSDMLARISIQASRISSSNSSSTDMKSNSTNMKSMWNDTVGALENVALPTYIQMLEEVAASLPSKSVDLPLLLSIGSRFSGFCNVDTINDDGVAPEQLFSLLTIDRDHGILSAEAIQQIKSYLANSKAVWQPHQNLASKLKDSLPLLLSYVDSPSDELFVRIFEYMNCKNDSSRFTTNQLCSFVNAFNRLGLADPHAVEYRSTSQNIRAIYLNRFIDILETNLQTAAGSGSAVVKKSSQSLTQKTASLSTKKKAQMIADASQIFVSGVSLLQYKDAESTKFLSVVLNQVFKHYLNSNIRVGDTVSLRDNPNSHWLVKTIEKGGSTSVLTLERVSSDNNAYKKSGSSAEASMDSSTESSTHSLPGSSTESSAGSSASTATPATCRQSVGGVYKVNARVCRDESSISLLREMFNALSLRFEVLNRFHRHSGNMPAMQGALSGSLGLHDGAALASQLAVFVRLIIDVLLPSFKNLEELRSLLLNSNGMTNTESQILDSLLDRAEDICKGNGQLCSKGEMHGSSAGSPASISSSIEATRVFALYVASMQSTQSDRVGKFAERWLTDSVIDNVNFQEGAAFLKDVQIPKGENSTSSQQFNRVIERFGKRIAHEKFSSLQVLWDLASPTMAPYFLERVQTSVLQGEGAELDLLNFVAWAGQRGYFTPTEIDGVLLKSKTKDQDQATGVTLRATQSLKDQDRASTVRNCVALVRAMASWKDLDKGQGLKEMIREYSAEFREILRDRSYSFEQLLSPAEIEELALGTVLSMSDRIDVMNRVIEILEASKGAASGSDANSSTSDPNSVPEAGSQIPETSLRAFWFLLQEQAPITVFSCAVRAHHNFYQECMAKTKSREASWDPKTIEDKGVVSYSKILAQKRRLFPEQDFFVADLFRLPLAVSQKRYARKQDATQVGSSQSQTSEAKPSESRPSELLSDNRIVLGFPSDSTVLDATVERVVELQGWKLIWSNKDEWARYLDR